MKSAEVNLCNLGPRLTLTFVILVALILGGNGLVIWQFQIARQQTARLTAVSRELIAVQRLQETLLIFHQRLDEIAHTKDARRLVTEAEPSLRALLEQADETRNTLTHLPAEIFVDPLEAIKVTLPSQLEGITSLAKSGDWEAVDLRLANELKPMETQTSILVNSIERQVRGEMAQAVANYCGWARLKTWREHDWERSAANRNPGDVRADLGCVRSIRGRRNHSSTSGSANFRRAPGQLRRELALL